tara:strand:- start:803 stop:1450 length:648 start_codon:yes stop_codon:yes gene_type:complete
MNILAIESSSKECNVAIRYNSTTYESSAEIKNDSATNLPIITEELINKLSLEFSNLDAIAISMGPGSFTGLRVALSYAKGLAIALDIPIIPISTFDVILLPYKKNIEEKLFTIIIHSHSNTVYHARYISNNNDYVLEKDPQSISIEELSKNNNGTVIYYGREHLIDYVNNLSEDIVIAQPLVKHVLDIGENNFDLLKTKSINNLVPNYIGSFSIG